jgi:hypothetical protein
MEQTVGLEYFSIGTDGFLENVRLRTSLVLLVKYDICITRASDQSLVICIKIG